MAALVEPTASDSSPPRILSTPLALRRRILLVEPDPDLARVLERELERTQTVVVVPTLARALAVLEAGTRLHVVLSANRLRDKTAAALFWLVRRRWSYLRRVVYAPAGRVRRPTRELAHAVVATEAPFEELLDAILQREDPS